MSTALSDTDVVLLRREADVGAARLVRRFRLPAHEREDIRQDLLADLIARLPAFDPARGSLGAFAGKVVAHRAARLAVRICRERDLFAPVSLDTPLAGTEGATLGDILPENAGYAAMMGQATDRFAAVERRLDLLRAVGQLRRPEQALCAELLHRTPVEISERGSASRASVYRKVQEIRLQLMVHGLADAA